MSNHTHVVLRIDPALPARWSDEEVARRWARLSRTLEAPSEEALLRRVDALLLQPERLAVLRERLGSLSWFMRFLNECIAREANAEDDCTGRFWEGRYRCQALLDESAVLACMAYVDLNPIRAGVADDLEGSDFTSIQRRLRVHRSVADRERARLVPLAGVAHEGGPALSFSRYLELLAWAVRGATPAGATRALQRLPVARGSPQWWTDAALRLERVFGSAVGLRHSLAEFAEATGRRWVRGPA
jgi:hypothetical protein